MAKKEERFFPNKEANPNTQWMCAVWSACMYGRVQRERQPLIVCLEINLGWAEWWRKWQGIALHMLA